MGSMGGLKAATLESLRPASMLTPAWTLSLSLVPQPVDSLPFPEIMCNQGRIIHYWLEEGLGSLSSSFCGGWSAMNEHSSDRSFCK